MYAKRLYGEICRIERAMRHAGLKQGYKRVLYECAEARVARYYRDLSDLTGRDCCEISEHVIGMVNSKCIDDIPF
jgi:hypothetical protein